MISVADILFVRNIFETSFVFDISSKYETTVILNNEVVYTPHRMESIIEC